jgi:hypothetical protein
MKKLILFLLLAVGLIGSGSASVLTGDLTNGLVAYYTFNNTLSDATGTLSSASNYGTYFTTGRFGNANGALGFNGSQYATISGLGSVFSGKSAITVSGWYLVDDYFGKYTSGFMTHSPGQEGITPSLTMEVSQYGALGGNMGVWQDVYTQGVPQRGNWQHIVSVIQQGSLPTMYLNGVAQSWMSPWIPNVLSNPIASFTSDYGLGARIENNSPNYFSSGAMSDLLFYQTALTSTQVSSLYALQSVPEPSTYALFGLGAIGMLMVLRRKKTA